MATAGSLVGICGLDLTLDPRTQQQQVVVYKFLSFFGLASMRDFVVNRLQCCLHFHWCMSRRVGAGLDLGGRLEEAGYLFKLAKRQATAEAAKAGRG